MRNFIYWELVQGGKKELYVFSFLGAFTRGNKELYILVASTRENKELYILGASTRENKELYILGASTRG